MELGSPLLAEPVSPVCVATPVVEAPLVMVEHILPAPVAENVAPAAPDPVAESVARMPVVSYTAPTPMDDFSASVPDVSHAASTSSSAPTPAHAYFEEWTARLHWFAYQLQSA